MKERIILIIYRALLPALFILAFPGWIVKMIRRGGFGTALNERLGIYFSEIDYEPNGAVHLHAVSVGETILALKLLREWSSTFPYARFVLATGTSTGHDTATRASIPNLRVTYSPLDFPWMVKSYLRRFEPAKILLIEGEIWPNLLRICDKKKIPVMLANARVSPRSAKRFQKFSPLLQPFFSRLDAVCIQEKEHEALWQQLGVPPENIHFTGSLKFDPQSVNPPTPRSDFAEMLAAFGENRPVILAASTFPGEEILIAEAIHAADPNFLPVIVPRHAERRSEVFQDLSQVGFSVTLRSMFPEKIATGDKQVFVIDSTGELATWTAHADSVIIGKSFQSHGGQNPAEAIIASKPLILGPHMENFQPLVRNLLAVGGALTAVNQSAITTAIQTSLLPTESKRLTENASRILSLHQGATQRHLKVLQTGSEHA
ncbi:3-deoxy-D-manno-octulosonic acid transferase [Luteolibacter algae]|uniref:3-deoxy-D-manno-octulosonic acid transferase n=1 Tax=Luteolibacter algae TaxID=454151 RepID=A0ABW5DDS1_9BACT